MNKIKVGFDFDNEHRIPLRADKNYFIHMGALMILPSRIEIFCRFLIVILFLVTPNNLLTYKLLAASEKAGFHEKKITFPMVINITHKKRVKTILEAQLTKTKEQLQSFTAYDLYYAVENLIKGVVLRIMNVNYNKRELTAAEEKKSLIEIPFIKNLIAQGKVINISAQCELDIEASISTDSDHRTCNSLEPIREETHPPKASQSFD